MALLTSLAFLPDRMPLTQCHFSVLVYCTISANPACLSEKEDCNVMRNASP